MPAWVDEVDSASGAVFYVNSESGETQWERPIGFVPVVRYLRPRDGDGSDQGEVGGTGGNNSDGASEGASDGGDSSDGEGDDGVTVTSL